MIRLVPELRLSLEGRARISWVQVVSCDGRACGSESFRAATADLARARVLARGAGFALGRGRDLCGVCAAATPKTSARPNPLGAGGGTPERGPGVPSSPLGGRRAHAASGVGVSR